jgi:hypothetical protein
MVDTETEKISGLCIAISGPAGTGYVVDPHLRPAAGHRLDAMPPPKRLYSPKRKSPIQAGATALSIAAMTDL